MKKYEEAVKYLFGLRRFGMRPGLESISLLLGELDNPQLSYKTIHVAGSKGKGSVCTFIASILQEAGYRVGLYTSPHLVSYTERIRVDGKEIRKEDLVRLATKINGISDRLKIPESRRLTFFEITTAIAFEHFREMKVDFAVLETGMGGRLDATNVCMPLVAVVTNIEKEHVETLGNTLGKIAWEKAGIIKPGAVAVTAETKAEPLKVIEDACRKKGVRLYKVGKDIAYGVVTNTLEAVHNTENEIGAPGEMPRTSFSVYGLFSDAYESVSTGLVGRHQTVNAVTAVAAVESLRSAGTTVPKKAIIKGLFKANIECRFQVMQRNPTVILDNAHTVASAEALRDTINDVIRDRVTLVIGISSGKDARGIIKALAPIAKKMVVTRAAIDRAMDAEIIAREAGAIFFKSKINKNKTNVKMYQRNSVIGGLKFALDTASYRETIVVTGSSYVCGEALGYFKGMKVDGLSDPAKTASFRGSKSGKKSVLPPASIKPEYIDIIFKVLRELFNPDSGAGSELASQSRSEDPFRVLIATILSQRTKDENTHKVVERLFSVYGTPEKLARAPLGKVEKLVHSSGFYRVKARNIIKVAGIVWKDYKGKVPDTIDELLALPSVGRKTANCVLVYAFNKLAIPVDTHVHRISNRLGLVRTQNPEETEAGLVEILPKKYWLEINDYLVQFGKTICRPIGPKCPGCPLNDICPSSTLR